MPAGLIQRNKLFSSRGLRPRERARPECARACLNSCRWCPQFLDLPFQFRKQILERVAVPRCKPILDHPFSKAFHIAQLRQPSCVMDRQLKQAAPALNICGRGPVQCLRIAPGRSLCGVCCLYRCLEVVDQIRAALILFRRAHDRIELAQRYLLDRLTVEFKICDSVRISAH